MRPINKNGYRVIKKIINYNKKIRKVTKEIKIRKKLTQIKTKKKINTINYYIALYI